MKLVTPLPRESILDICISQCGSLEALFSVISLNKLMTLDVSQIAALKTPDAFDALTLKWYTDNNIRPTTISQQLTYGGDFNDDFNDDFNI